MIYALNGTYEMQSVLKSDLVLDIQRVIQYTWNGGANQKWVLKKVK